MDRLPQKMHRGDRNQTIDLDTLTNKTIIVTGGAGFIGSNLIRHMLEQTSYNVVNVDKLTYAGNLESLADLTSNPRYRWEQVDIVDSKAVDRLFDCLPDAVLHLAAETHVDRSIDGPQDFIQTNLVGTYHLLQSARSYFESQTGDKKNNFRFHHVSTDEVYGSLASDDEPFNCTTAYDPHSPYSASKAGSDHLVRAWSATYGLPVLVSSSSNNFGPYQHPEKLIPLVILKAIRGESIPIYGDGTNIRDWLYVNDHVAALMSVLENGRPGQTYTVGGNNEQSNLELVRNLCRILDDVHPISQNKSFPTLTSGQPTEPGSPSTPITKYEQLIKFVPDRPGHDFRYATDNAKIKNELGWQPRESGQTGLEKTVQWYLQNRTWWQPLIDRHPTHRPGLAGLSSPPSNSELLAANQ